MQRIFAIAVLAATVAAPVCAQQYDVVIGNATIVDGTGAARYTGALAISGGRVAKLSREQIPAAQGKRYIDAKGHIVAPGVIDLHAHIEPVLSMPDAESAARQGVTLEIGRAHV